jgi:adenylate kinase family enzyme
MKRILLVGISGTGKTVLARRLSGQLQIPVTYCDAIAWKPGWVREDPKMVTRQLKQVLNKAEWIIEGYIEPLSAERISEADAIIYLDYPGYVALIGGLRRWWKYRGKERPEMQPGNKEDFVLRLLWGMLRRHERAEIERAISGNEGKVIRLTSWKAVNNFRIVDDRFNG